MNIQVGDIVRNLENRFLHLVLDMYKSELGEHDQVLLQRVGDNYPQWALTSELELVENK